MLGAAKRLGVSQARLSRHIAALEDAVGTRLFDRSTRGCLLTEDGISLLSTAERVEAETLTATQHLKGETKLAGTVRIGAPDGFGSAFLAPRLDKFRSTYPDLQTQLVPAPRSFSLSEREADLAIMVGRPNKGRLRVQKLVDYTLGVYATATYLDQNTAPTTLTDLKTHCLVGYVDDLVYTPELNYAADLGIEWRSDIGVSTAIGQFEAVRSGAGIGILHDFMTKDKSDLVRLFPKHSIKRSYWLVWHENLRKERRVKAVVDLIDTLVQKDRPLFSPMG